MNNMSFQPNDINAVLEKYSDLVYKIAYSQMKNKFDADDVFQEVFVRLIKAKVQFENEEHTKAWLIRVTINYCKSLYNSAWFKKKAVITENIDTYEEPETSDLYDTVMELPQKYRIVIHLFYYEDMPISAIAKALGKTENTIKSQLSRAKKLLKQKLKGVYDNV